MHRTLLQERDVYHERYTNCFSLYAYQCKQSHQLTTSNRATSYIYYCLTSCSRKWSWTINYSPLLQSSDAKPMQNLRLYILLRLQLGLTFLSAVVACKWKGLTLNFKQLTEKWDVHCSCLKFVKPRWKFSIFSAVSHFTFRILEVTIQLHPVHVGLKNEHFTWAQIKMLEEFSGTGNGGKWTVSVSGGTHFYTVKG